MTITRNTKIVVAVTILMVCLGSQHSIAQKFKAEAYVDTNAILIGDQVSMTLTLIQQFEQGILWPEIGDTITGKIEVLGRSESDTLKRSGDGTIEVAKVYQLTSFDSGYFIIPPLRFTDVKDTNNFSETEAILIEVQTLEVDTTMALKDIKAPLDVPYTWDEFIMHGVVGLTTILVALLVYLLYRKWKNRPVKVVVEKIIVRDPHLIALEDLNALEQKKLWQQDNIKLYYTELTDIIRTYIENRFEIIAMEMTTDEIMDSIAFVDVSPTCKEKLRQLLMTADMVKFAKSKPIGSEHELCMANAYLFVNETLLVTANEEAENVVPENSPPKI